MSCMEGKRNVYEVLVGKPESKRILARPKHRWQGDISIDLKEIEWGEWIGLI